MAVVCSGMASRKWRTIITRAKAVHPCEPWNMGRHPFMPMKARAAPSGALIFSGLADRALPWSITTFMPPPH